MAVRNKIKIKLINQKLNEFFWLCKKCDPKVKSLEWLKQQSAARVRGRWREGLGTCGRGCWKRLISLQIEARGEQRMAGWGNPVPSGAWPFSRALRQGRQFDGRQRPE